MAEHGSPLEHVMDHPTIEIPGGFSFGGVGPEIHLPQILGVQLTRFMVMEIVAAILVILVIVPLTRHIARNKVTRGPFWIFSRPSSSLSATASPAPRSASRGPIIAMNSRVTLASGLHMATGMHTPGTFRVMTSYRSSGLFSSSCCSTTFSG